MAAILQAERKSKRRSTSRPERLRPLRRCDVPSDTAELARYLIGTILVSEGAHGRAAAAIVETEAYIIGDAASHAARGRTARNGAMFLPPGHAYVYFIYGTSYCINVSSEEEAVGAAVLLRAGKPLLGIELMAARRGNVLERDLCRGPGRLAQALAVTRFHDGLDLCAPGPLWLAAPRQTSRAIGTSVRIGLTKEAQRDLRFYERGSLFVSGPRRVNDG